MTRSVEKHHVAGEAQQHEQGERLQQPVLDEHPRAFEVEHAAGDQVARMDAVMEAKGQALKLLEILEPKIAGDLLADILAEIAGEHGQGPADDAGGDHQHRRAPQRGPRLRCMSGAGAQQRLGLVDGGAEQSRQGQARHRRSQRTGDRQGQAAGVAQGERGDPLQDPRHLPDVDLGGLRDDSVRTSPEGAGIIHRKGHALSMSPFMTPGPRGRPKWAGEVSGLSVVATTRPMVARVRTQYRSSPPSRPCENQARNGIPKSVVRGFTAAGQAEQ
jgi:hypothetical protein